MTSKPETNVNPPECARGFPEMTPIVIHQLIRHHSQIRRRQPTAEMDAVLAIHREPGHFAARLLMRECAWRRTNVHGIRLMIRMPRNANRRLPSQARSQHRCRLTIPTDAAREPPTTSTRGHSAQITIMEMTA